MSLSSSDSKPDALLRGMHAVTPGSVSHHSQVWVGSVREKLALDPPSLL